MLVRQKDALRMRNRLRIVLTAAVFLILAVRCSNAPLYYNQGVRAYDGGEFAAAAKYFEKAANIEDDEALYYNSAIARWKQAKKEAADYDEAYDVVEAAIDRDDVSSSHRMKLLFVAGDLRLAQGRTLEARRVLEQAQQEWGEDPPYLPVLHRLAEINAGDSPDDAMNLLLHAVELEDPDIERGANSVECR